MRGETVLLMGEETVESKGGSGAVMYRRFTDLCKPVDNGWRLTARQATVIARP